MDKKDYEIFLKAVGANIRNIRNEKGLSMETLAHQTEIEYRQIGRIERGEVNTTIISLHRIAEVLKVDITLFFTL